MKDPNSRGSPPPPGREPRRPESAPTSERAIPVSIFSAEPAVARAWLRKWCGDVGSGEFGGPARGSAARGVLWLQRAWHAPLECG
jgi:hypothetical protein